MIKYARKNILLFFTVHIIIQHICLYLNIKAKDVEKKTQPQLFLVCHHRLDHVYCLSYTSPNISETHGEYSHQLAHSTNQDLLHVNNVRRGEYGARCSAFVKFRIGQ